MTYFIGDGFDWYAAVTDGGANFWETSGVGANIDATFTRFGTGQCILINNSGFAGDCFTKTGSTNEATWFASIAVATVNTAAVAMIAVAFRDGGTAQCTVAFQGNGSIVVYSGAVGGAVLATFLGALPVANDWHQFQIKAIIHNTAGEVHIRKDGATSDTYVVTGVNTRGGTANNYANAVCLRKESGSFTRFDDLLFYNGNVSDTPNDWIGDVRAVQLPPTLDISTAFARVSTGSLVAGISTSNSTRAIVANQLWTTTRFSVTQGGVFSSCTFAMNAGFTGKAKIALYLADGNVQGGVPDNQPGTLIAVSNEIVNPATGANTATFANPVGMMKGYSYFFAILTDTNCTVSSTSGGTEFVYTGSYVSGFPNSLTGLNVAAPAAQSPTISVTLTANNAGCVSDEFQDTLTTYLQDNVVGHSDLYNIFGLWYTPASVVGVNLRALVQKSQATARGFKITASSGGVAFDSTEYALTTSFSQFNSFKSTDPATGLAWLPAAVNALQIGPKVSS